MLITNEPKIAQLFIDDYDPDWVNKVCFHRRQYYIYYKHDVDELDYIPSLIAFKKIKTPIPNVGIFEPFKINIDEQLYQFKFQKGIVTCNEDSIIKSGSIIYNFKEMLDKE